MKLNYIFILIAIFFLSNEKTFGSVHSAPTINVNGSIVAFPWIVAGQTSAPQSFVLSGNLLKDKIIVRVPPSFELSFDSLSGFKDKLELIPIESVIPVTKIFVRISSYATSASAGVSGKIYITSSDIATQSLTIPFSSVYDNMNTYLTLSGTLSEFNSIVGAASNEQHFYVSVNYANKDKNIYLSAPSGYELSLDSSSYQNQLVVFYAKKVFIRLSENAPIGTISQNYVTITSKGEAIKYLPIPESFVKNVTGLIINQSDKLVEICPNPSNHYITVGENYHSTIESIQGVVIINSDENVIDISYLQSGFYLVKRIDSSGNVSISKIFKQ